MPLNAPVVLQPASTPPTLGRKRAMILRMSVEAIQALQNSLNEDGGKGPKRPMQIQFGPDGVCPSNTAHHAWSGRAILIAIGFALIL